MTERNVRTITLNDDDWMNGGTDNDHLTAVLVINGTYHHLEAIRVSEDDDGQQRSESPSLQDSINAMYQIGGDGPFDTVSINGDSYVLVVIPFQ